jgi:hypothetical protein
MKSRISIQISTSSMLKQKLYKVITVQERALAG